MTLDFLIQLLVMASLLSDLINFRFHQFSKSKEIILNSTKERVKITLLAMVEDIRRRNKNQRCIPYIFQYIGFLSFDYINHFIILFCHANRICIG